MYGIFTKEQTFAQTIDYNLHINKILYVFEKCKEWGWVILKCYNDR
jgi:hypothetical protein